ncbi:helix-turn-helix domain-containing protein [Bradyrhizobium sp. USDA 3364]
MNRVALIWRGEKDVVWLAGGAMEQLVTVRTDHVRDFEDLGAVVADAPRTIVQLGRGKLEGRLVHASVGGLALDVASFNLGLRSRGATSNRDRVSISMLTECGDRVSRSSFESRPGDVLITPPGQEHENRYHGSASVAVISMTEDDIRSAFGNEAWLADMMYRQRSHYRANAATVERAIPVLRSFIERLVAHETVFTKDSAMFWRRAIIEAMTAPLLGGLRSTQDGPRPSASKIVNRVEEFLDARAPAPIHISEICSGVGVSRRTLHRAFNEVLGMGPIAFLRYRRLCTIHTIISCGLPDDVTIADLAMQYGFLELGRFAANYRQLFGENPSQTLRHRRAQLSLAEARDRLRAGRVTGLLM